ncbi:MFS transporter [Exilibacterium tricleocarpae]|uniref:MFS transporter n=1 Tax=Exilibacterium tricleocarpae TaxID=2591008 RepID=A0A545TNC1_9GAMM|nr:MFS transporter [Exilibacterium tricleocarpae]
MSNLSTQHDTHEILAEQKQFAWRSEAYAWCVVVLLILALTLSMIDRMILTLLVGPIKADFGLSDTQISLLHGLAFTLLYVVAGLPMGRLADHYSRRAIAGWSVFSWSLATAMCGVTNNFWQLFVSRVCVGIGEAGLSPAAVSMISDYFSKAKVAKPIAYYSIGASAGAGLAYIFGGVVVDYVSTLGPVTIPVFGVIRPWQLAFFAVGLPGILFAAVFMFVREPKRNKTQQEIEAGERVPVSEVVAFFMRHKDFLILQLGAASMAALAILSLHAWMPAFLMRTYGLSPGQAGTGYGVAVLIGGVSGLLLTGWLSNHWTAKGMRAAHIRIACLSVAISTIPAVLTPLVPNFYLSIILSGFAVFGFAAAIALAPVALQVSVPNNMRGQIYAFYLLTISVLGYTVGPMIVALITDLVFQDEMKVGLSMALVVAIAGPVSAIGFGLARTKYFGE